MSKRLCKPIAHHVTVGRHCPQLCSMRTESITPDPSLVKVAQILAGRTSNFSNAGSRLQHFLQLLTPNQRLPFRKSTEKTGEKQRCTLEMNMIAKHFDFKHGSLITIF